MPFTVSPSTHGPLRRCDSHPVLPDCGWSPGTESRPEAPGPQLPLVRGQKLMTVALTFLSMPSKVGFVFSDANIFLKINLHRGRLGGSAG